MYKKLVALLVLAVLAACAPLSVDSRINQFQLDFSEGLVYPDKIRAITLWYTANAPASIGNTRLIFEGCANAVIDIRDKYFVDAPLKTFESWNVNPDDLEMLVMLIGEHLPAKVVPAPALRAVLAHDGTGTDGHIVWEWQNTLPVICDDRPVAVPPPIPSKSDRITDRERQELFDEINSFLEVDYATRTYGGLAEQPLDAPVSEVSTSSTSVLVIPLIVVFLIALALFLNLFRAKPSHAQ